MKCQDQEVGVLHSTTTLKQMKKEFKKRNRLDMLYTAAKLDNQVLHTYKDTAASAPSNHSNKSEVLSEWVPIVKRRRGRPLKTSPTVPKKETPSLKVTLRLPKENKQKTNANSGTTTSQTQNKENSTTFHQESLSNTTPHGKESLKTMEPPHPILIPAAVYGYGDPRAWGKVSSVVQTIPELSLSYVTSGGMVIRDKRQSFSMISTNHLNVLEDTSRYGRTLTHFLQKSKEGYFKCVPEGLLLRPITQSEKSSQKEPFEQQSNVDSPSPTVPLDFGKGCQLCFKNKVPGCKVEQIQLEPLEY